jgi:hypothetical protein
MARKPLVDVQIDSSSFRAIKEVGLCEDDGSWSILGDYFSF